MVWTSLFSKQAQRLLTQTTDRPAVAQIHWDPFMLSKLFQLRVIGLKYADKSRVVAMVQVPRLRYRCKTSLLTNGRRKKKKKENPLKPMESAAP